MAAEDSNRLESARLELDDTISCCICTNVYTKPKALPCIHTFCATCLEQTGINTNKGPGDEMPCPICRRQFKIPQEGFSGLPNNFFIAKLIQGVNASNPAELSKDSCDVCLKDSEEKTMDISKASMYCTDCRQKLCEKCCRDHRKFKLLTSHKLISISEHLAGDESVQVNLAPSVCEFHEQKVLDVYCNECKTVECAICFIDGHRQHEGSHVRKYVDDFRKQIKSNIETINGCNSEAQMKIDGLNKIKEDTQQKVERLESDVISRRDELKKFADSQAHSLMQNICSLSQTKYKEIQMEVDDTDAHMSCLQTYSSFCQKIVSNGSDSDICRAATDLSAKAVELQGQCQALIKREILFFDVSFTKSEITECLEDNLIGKIEDDSNLGQRKTTTSKVALIKEQSNEIDHLKETINLERRETENFRLENEQLKLSINSEKTTNKKLEVENDRLRQELETQRKTVQDLLKGKEEANEEWKKTKKDLIAKNLEVEQKWEEERERLTKEKEQLNSQKSELQISLDKIRSEYKLDPVLRQTIRTTDAAEQKKSIAGLTILDNELFVLSEMSSEVEVYSSISLGFRRRWNLKELIQPQDIVSCNRNKCLYIFDYKGILSWSNEILRVDPNGNLIKKWSTRNNFGYSLSVTNESNIIFPVYSPKKLNEYSPDGKLIRELNLMISLFFCQLWHAVKLTNGHFVVSLRTENLLAFHHGLCLVDEHGIAKKMLVGKFIPSIGYMNVPFHLAVDGNGFVMVADQENGRVLLFDSDLEFKREILQKDGKHGLRRPTRILLDKSYGSDQLLVADNEPNNQRILIFKVN